MTQVKKLNTNTEKLTVEETRHIAKLANLPLTDKEIEKFRSQLSEILNYIGQLSEVETKNVEPTSQVTGMENVFRQDKAKSSLSQDEALSGAKNNHKGFFKVKAVFE